MERLIGGLVAFANIKRSFSSLSAAARESVDSRVYAGIHSSRPARTDCSSDARLPSVLQLCICSR
jgi:hypothetical protein